MARVAAEPVLAVKPRNPLMLVQGARKYHLLQLLIKLLNEKVLGRVE